MKQKERKIVFLDIDGVLNHDRYFLSEEFKQDKSRGNNYHICCTSVSRLNTLLEKTQAKVVISSTWRREHSISQLQELLEAKGFKGEIIGKTPNFAEEYGSIYYRADEIVSYLKTHPEVKHFTVLEDDEEMPGIEEYVVRIDSSEGITQKDVAKAESILLEKLPTRLD